MQDINLIAGEDAVLLLHGLASSPLEMRYVAKMLHRDGFSVAVPHIPGYGYGGKATDWRQWRDYALSAYDRLKRDYRTVSVGGLCIGAVLALSVAIEKGRDIAALSLLSTTLEYDGWSVPWYRFLLPVGFYTPLRYVYAYPEREPVRAQERSAQATGCACNAAGTGYRSRPDEHSAQSRLSGNAADSPRQAQHRSR